MRGGGDCSFTMAEHLLKLGYVKERGGCGVERVREGRGERGKVWGRSRMGEVRRAGGVYRYMVYGVICTRVSIRPHLGGMCARGLGFRVQGCSLSQAKAHAQKQGRPVPLYPMPFPCLIP